jgi:hypothetical protein
MSQSTQAIGVRNSSDAIVAVSPTNPVPMTGSGTAIAPSSTPVTTHLGNFQIDVVEVNLSLDTNAYATGDVLAETQSVTVMAAPPAGGMRGEIVGVTILDKDDQGGALDLVFLDAASSLGTENAVTDIDDTEAEDVITTVPVGSGDYTDLGANRVARPSFDPIPFKVAGGAIFVGAISRDSKTYSAAGLRLKIAVRIHNAGLLS